MVREATMTCLTYSALQFTSLICRKNTDAVAVKKMIIAEENRRSVSVSPNEHGAINVFHTMSIPVTGAMTDAGAMAYPAMSHAGFNAICRARPQGHKTQTPQVSNKLVTQSRHQQQTRGFRPQYFRQVAGNEQNLSFPLLSPLLFNLRC